MGSMEEAAQTRGAESRLLHPPFRSVHRAAHHGVTTVADLRQQAGPSHQDDLKPTLFLLRPEVSEARFPETYGDSIDGAVLLGRLLADGGRGGSGEDLDRLPVGEAARDQSADQLARVARAHSLLHLHDPDTAVLPHLRDHEDLSASRACRMSAALAVDLPLQASDLDNREARERFVRATLRSQVAVTRPAPPYFEFGAINDVWLRASLLCVAETVRLLPSRPPAIFVRGSLEALMSGALAASATRYRRVVPGAAWLLLSVSGLHPEQSSADELGTYLHAIRTFDRVGFEVFADRVDHLAPAAVAEGAIGLAGGSRTYRVTPPKPFWENDFTVKVRLKTAMPRRGDRLTPEVARRRRAKGSADSCPIPRCKVLEHEVSNGAIRAHYGHLTQHELEQARVNGLEWVAQRYEKSPIKVVRKLGEAVRVAQRLAEAA